MFTAVEGIVHLASFVSTASRALSARVSILWTLLNDCLCFKGDSFIVSEQSHFGRSCSVAFGRALRTERPRELAVSLSSIDGGSIKSVLESEHNLEETKWNFWIFNLFNGYSIPYPRNPYKVFVFILPDRLFSHGSCAFCTAPLQPKLRRADRTQHSNKLK